jgi:hypothetical protein
MPSVSHPLIHVNGYSQPRLYFVCMLSMPFRYGKNPGLAFHPSLGQCPAMADNEPTLQCLPLPMGHQDRFTTEDLDPLKREQILAMSNDGATLKEIATALCVSEHTIMAVRKLAGFDWRATAIAHLEQAIPLGASRLREAFRTMDPDKIAIPWAIAVDKMLLLKGESTAIVEHRHTVDLTTLSTGLNTPEITVQALDSGDSLSTTPEIPQNPQ